MKIWYPDIHRYAQVPGAMISNDWKGWQAISEKVAMGPWAY